MFFLWIENQNPTKSTSKISIENLTQRREEMRLAINRPDFRWVFYFPRAG